MSKILITSGCSFSETTNPEEANWHTWPAHLYKNLESYDFTEFRNSAMGSQGNGLISRGVMYNVIDCLKTYKKEDILVGVMWSGSNRWDYRCTNPELLSWGSRGPRRIYGKNIDGWIENPTGFVKNAYKNWVIMNVGWRIEEAKIYYKNFHDFIGCSIASIEHILRLQLFLKSKGIKYFFTNYVDNNIIDRTNTLYEAHREEVDYLYDQIDFTDYLPVSSEHRWVYENATDKEQYHKNHLYNGNVSDWIHPQKHHHKQFTDEVIMPWLLERNYI